jgi:superfamily I DNA and/or RNA helicase
MLGRIGFLADSRRLNVAMTRGRFGCYIVGRKQTLEQDAGWQALLRRAGHNRMRISVERARSESIDNLI